MKKILPYLGLALLLIPLVVGAQEGPARGAWELGDITTILDKVATWMYVIGLAVALVVIIVGGIGYMTAAGNEDRQKAAKKTIITGLIGAAVIVLAGVILDTIVSFIA